MIKKKPMEYKDTINDDIVKQAREKLWSKGNLEWKLSVTQKKVNDFFKSKLNKVLTLSCTRRGGKSYLLIIYASQICLSGPNKIVKYVLPEQKMARTIIKPLIREIFKDCPDHLKPKYNSVDSKYVFQNGSEIQLAGSDAGNADRLRGCLEENTLILTPTGNVAIKDLKIGDSVYGYDPGTDKVSVIPVTEHVCTGEKFVTDIYLKNQYMGACTDEHRWLTSSTSSLSRNKKNYKVANFENIDEHNHRIIRRLQKIPCGNIDEPHAYVIGAFIGDGIGSATHYNYLQFASKDDLIPKKLAEILNCEFKNIGNCKYKLTSNLELNKHSEIIQFNYFNEWIKNKYCENKNFDWSVVNTWNRKSLLKLLAGLIDTDGNVNYNKKDSSLELSYTSINKNLIENIKLLLYKLTQFIPSIKIIKASRTNIKGNEYNTQEKYTIRIRNSFIVKKLLKEIDPYLSRRYKGYLHKYENIDSKFTDEFVKITKGRRYKAKTYDITVGNTSHLYLTAQGLVTHNTDAHLCLVDEAGFCSDLTYIINSVLMPLTLLTNGKIILSSTVPPNSEHEFVTKYMNTAAQNDTLMVKTIFDFRDDDLTSPNPRITDETIQQIIDAIPGGIESPAFQNEYMCRLVHNGENSVIPEFSPELEKDIIVPWQKPPFANKYEAMDIGFRDLTGCLFAYYDFDNAVVVVEDEVVMSGPSMTTEALAKRIKDKERELWEHKLTGEVEKVYKRVADNNLILLNDLARLHGIYFMATRKDDKEAQINNLRMMLASRQVIINPRCKVLIHHIKTTMWNKQRTDFMRTPDGAHGDLLMALVYLIRNIDKNNNPYPGGYRNRNIPRADLFDYGNDDDDKFSEFKEMFRTKKVGRK